MAAGRIVAGPITGYYYRILKRLGKNAAGGAHDDVAHGHMIGGFALLAYPAAYGASGVMTFIVNQEGGVDHKESRPRYARARASHRVLRPRSELAEAATEGAGPNRIWIFPHLSLITRT